MQIFEAESLINCHLSGLILTQNLQSLNMDYSLKWFRQACPYINAHRGKTFVVLFGGEAVESEYFPRLIHDFTLLHSLGIHLVLVHGAKPQIEKCLHEAGHKMPYINGLRLTNLDHICYIQRAVGWVRIWIESLLSMGIANSPMHGARLRVISGNMITAQPLGVCNGIDYGFTGEVRRIDDRAIQLSLDHGAIVLLSSIGYSPTGEIFILSEDEVATATAIALRADKLIILSENPTVIESNGRSVRELSLSAAELLLNQGNNLREEMVNHLRRALCACRAGVRRVHLLQRCVDGVLLLELFTRDGIGTLITEDIYEGLRSATIDDVGGILELIRPLEEDGTLVRRSRKRLETEIERFILLERDSTIIGCMALYPFPRERLGELACVAMHPQYRDNGRAELLLHYIERQARNQNLNRLFVLTTRTAHWFQERGFEPANVTDLPVRKQGLYNWKRCSKVFIKNLD